jgi:hypothetical protein
VPARSIQAARSRSSGDERPDATEVELGAPARRAAVSRAYPIISANVFTFGGLKVNANAQVINSDGEPIRGLYAAGETVGLYYKTWAWAPNQKSQLMQRLRIGGPGFCNRAARFVDC